MIIVPFVGFVACLNILAALCGFFWGFLGLEVVLLGIYCLLQFMRQAVTPTEADLRHISEQLAQEDYRKGKLTAEEVEELWDGKATDYLVYIGPIDYVPKDERVDKRV